ncbi:MAG: Hpt domain-containing protein [Candidatus Promineifilaceae bacterium]
MDRQPTPINFSALAERFERDSDEMLARLGPIYLDTMPDAITLLQTVGQSADLGNLRDIAHKIRGNAAAISAERLVELAKTLEKRAHILNKQEAQQLIVQVSAENERVINWLNQKLNNG